jgi:hypothetical protein
MVNKLNLSGEKLLQCLSHHAGHLNHSTALHRDKEVKDLANLHPTSQEGSFVLHI